MIFVQSYVHVQYINFYVRYFFQELILQNDIAQICKNFVGIYPYRLHFHQNRKIIVADQHIAKSAFLRQIFKNVNSRVYRKRTFGVKNANIFLFRILFFQFIFEGEYKQQRKLIKKKEKNVRLRFFAQKMLLLLIIASLHVIVTFN